ncbi:MAG: YbaB/EbfC family nucleoid-associated protein [Candidatus Delongbacteria bacterium]|jgi:DNA-binding YbaB/EbfC family protein|nr:YbaB/EbfC family nucleoid-associated protein [Candidatus Delongbacteria bacterium]MDD4205305.1 YbaB/EbfC family nucleoid-associated protein [Candidatus Delongbacteria bacterium]MDY0016331.1 YbaB/EbfC family nucleoid-associated protein [Candidatus Delongbacteria bacterium]
MAGMNMDMSSLLKQAQKMQEDMQRSQQMLESTEVEGTAGGGMVKVKMNGKKKLMSVNIDPKVIDPDDSEGLEDLIIAAVNQASEEVDRISGDEMSKIAPKLPDGFKIPGF